MPWTMALPLASRRTCVQPAGGVITVEPRVDTAATRTSPACTPAGAATDTLVVALDAVAAPTKLTPDPTGGGVPPASVVTEVAGEEGAETLPAASTAVTG